MAGLVGGHRLEVRLRGNAAASPVSVGGGRDVHPRSVVADAVVVAVAVDKLGIAAARCAGWS